MKVSVLLSIIFIIFCTSPTAFPQNESTNQPNNQATTYLAEIKSLENKRDAITKALDVARLFAEQAQWDLWYDAYKLIYDRLKYGTLSDFQEGIYYLTEAQKTIQTVANAQSIIGKIYVLIAHLQYHAGNFDEALQLYEQSIAYLNEQLDKNTLVPALINAGRLYWNQGNDFRALPYLEKSLTLTKQLCQDETLSKIERNKQINRITNITIAIADVYRNTKRAKKSLNYYNEAIQLNPTYYLSYVLRSKLYVDPLQDYTNALKDAQYALTLAQQGDYQTDRVDANHQLGLVYMSQKDFVKALEKYKYAYNLGKKYYGTQHNECAKIPVYIGQAYQKQAKYDTALYYYQQTLLHLLPHFKDVNINNNPKFSELHNNIWVMHALIHKGLTFYQKYSQTQSRSDLQRALDTYQLLIDYFDKLKNNYTEEASKQLLHQYTYPVYEQAIQVALTFCEKTQDTQYQELAFHFAQRAKAFVLREHLSEKQAMSISKVPADRMTHLQTLKESLVALDKAIYQTDPNNEPTLDSLKSKQFAIKREHEQHLQSLYANYSDYAKFKQTLQISSIAQVQEHLGKTEQQAAKQGLVEYFVGDSSIYIFAITADFVHIGQQKIPDEFTRNCRQLLRATSDWQFVTTNAKEAEKQYLATAHLLYQQLLAPALNQTAFDNVKQLTFVTDGILAQLPFDILLYETATEWRAKNVPYLLQKYATSYVYSSSLLNLGNNRHQNETNRQAFGGFALQYDDYTLQELAKNTKQTTQDTILAYLVRSNILTKLPHAPSEVENASYFFDTKAEKWLNKAATKQNFLAHADKYQILHLAMHGVLDKENPLYSSLIFTKTDSLNEHFLYAREVYDLNLQADLTVLSACNTGLGELQRGEGIMSLARAFAFAGCPSTLMSLWSIADGSASKVMQLFYRNLHEGQNKAKALQQAKLAYLNSTNPQNRMPIHWAASVVMGDVTPLSIGASDLQYHYWLAFLLIGGVLFLVVWKHKYH